MEVAADPRVIVRDPDSKSRTGAVRLIGCSSRISSARPRYHSVRGARLLIDHGVGPEWFVAVARSGAAEWRRGVAQTYRNLGLEGITMLGLDLTATPRLEQLVVARGCC